MGDSSAPHFYTRPPEGFGGKISFILTDLITELQKRNARKDVGIFRVNGNSTSINAIAARMDVGRFKEWEQYDNNTIACTLKKHFRDTVDTDPLFSQALFDKIKNVVSEENSDESFITAFREVLGSLTRPRYYTIVFLFKYLREVADLSETNKMGSQGISICMSPNLFTNTIGQSSNTADCIAINGIQNKIIQRLVDVSHALFDDVEIPDDMLIDDSDIPKLLAPVMDPKESSSFLEWRQVRRKSKIPFVPLDLSRVPGFLRPIDPIKI